ncbi:DUF2971 domain-containing protein [Bradyrhizobium sp. 2S1]|uniref:DUF2971 domain-containing protein n=1 Tax=Bradyrhizobium sp. 2S1 TaxID=1404429 RepID=UPI001595E1C1
MSELHRESRPMILYHYTSAAGLYGIVASKSLWTSHYRFLNDTSEFRHGWDIVLAAIERRGTKIKQISSLAWERITRFREHSESVHAFVGSLTSNGDLLSQWRGYNRGQGFSIGFDADWLRQNAEEQRFDITPVIYDTEQQHAAADEAVAQLVARLLEGTDEPEGARAQVKRWWPHALKTALALKNEHFREECESRLVWADVSWPPGLKTRVAPAGLVPYRSCQFGQFNKIIIPNSTSHPNNCGIEEIILGPALAPQQVWAVEALLATHQMRLAIKQSAIPYVAD